MGGGYSKCKRKKKRNSPKKSVDGKENYYLAPETSDEVKVEEEVQGPTIKWRKANPTEEILKIQQAAEIKDIETIYENSEIDENKLLNKMPDHYWVGRENKLPRYVEYRGDHPNLDEKSSNLCKLKTSSMKDLSDSMSLNFMLDDGTDDSFHDRNYNKYVEKRRRNSCPNFMFYYDFDHKISNNATNKNNIPVPSKGILKKKNINRPISAMIELNEVKISSTNDSHEEENIIDQMSNLILTNGCDVNGHINSDEDSNTSNKDEEEEAFSSSSSAFSGYFDAPKNMHDFEIMNNFELNENEENEDDDSLQVNEEKKLLIKDMLDKRLNLRPTSTELTDRNILHVETESERNCGLERKKSFLNEKLSSRPTITELKKKKIIKFNDFIEVKETDNYDRTVNKTWARLTNYDRENIRNELNELKREMEIHESSRNYTRFHDPTTG